MQYEIEVAGRLRQVQVHRMDGHFVVGIDGHEWTVDAARIDSHVVSLLVGTASHEVTLALDHASGQLTVGVDSTPVVTTLNRRRRWGPKEEGPGSAGPERLVAPMPGKIVRLLVEPGQVVRARQPLVVIEAMKMENELRASREGAVARVYVEEGQSVDAGALLLVVGSA